MPLPRRSRSAAQEAIAADVNQYAITWGAKNLRNAIARQMQLWQGIAVDPETRNHRLLRLDRGHDFDVDGDLQCRRRSRDLRAVLRELRAGLRSCPARSRGSSSCARRPRRTASGPSTRANCAPRFTHHTKAIIVNTPNNPTGKVFTRSELELIRDLCVEFNVLAITDEIYEHILYDGTRHISMAALEGMRERTITINGLSKTYSVTGWRVGWAIAPPAITDAIRKVHDFLTVGAPAPLQEAGAAALGLPASYYQELADGYRKRRDRLIPVLNEAGLPQFSSARRLLRHD